MTRRLGPGRRRRLRRDAVRQAPRRDLRLPRADAPRPRARRRPHPGRVRQGLQELRHPREGRERARVAVPDRPPRGARRHPPPKIVRMVPWTGECHGAAPSAERLAMDARLSGPLERALAKIPERQRAALLLAELHDLTGLELAAAMGVSHVAARAILTRARESLRRALAAEKEAEQAAEAERDAPRPPRRGAADDPAVPRAAHRPDEWPSSHDRARARTCRSASTRRSSRAEDAVARRATSRPAPTAARSRRYTADRRAPRPARSDAAAAARPVGPDRRRPRSRGAGSACRTRQGPARRSRRSPLRRFSPRLAWSPSRRNADSSWRRSVRRTGGRASPPTPPGDAAGRRRPPPAPVRAHAARRPRASRPTSGPGRRWRGARHVRRSTRSARDPRPSCAPTRTTAAPDPRARRSNASTMIAAPEDSAADRRQRPRPRPTATRSRSSSPRERPRRRRSEPERPADRPRRRPTPPAVPRRPSARADAALVDRARRHAERGADADADARAERRPPRSASRRRRTADRDRLRRDRGRRARRTPRAATGSPSRPARPTARPGPDLYLWQVGDAAGRNHDHADHRRRVLRARGCGDVAGRRAEPSAPAEHAAKAPRRQGRARCRPSVPPRSRDLDRPTCPSRTSGCRPSTRAAGRGLLVGHAASDRRWPRLAPRRRAARARRLGRPGRSVATPSAATAASDRSATDEPTRRSSRLGRAPAAVGRLGRGRAGRRDRPL